MNNFQGVHQRVRAWLVSARSVVSLSGTAGTLRLVKSSPGLVSQVWWVGSCRVEAWSVAVSQDRCVKSLLGASRRSLDCNGPSRQGRLVMASQGEQRHGNAGADGVSWPDQLRHGNVRQGSAGSESKGEPRTGEVRNGRAGYRSAGVDVQSTACLSNSWLRSSGWLRFGNAGADCLVVAGNGPARRVSQARNEVACQGSSWPVFQSQAGTGLHLKARLCSVRFLTAGFARMVFPWYGMSISVCLVPVAQARCGVSSLVPPSQVIAGKACPVPSRHGKPRFAGKSHKQKRRGRLLYLRATN